MTGLVVLLVTLSAGAREPDMSYRDHCLWEPQSQIDAQIHASLRCRTERALAAQRRAGEQRESEARQAEMRRRNDQLLRRHFGPRFDPSTITERNDIADGRVIVRVGREYCDISTREARCAPGE